MTSRSTSAGLAIRMRSQKRGEPGQRAQSPAHRLRVELRGQPGAPPAFD
jgi:hypothetical protein